MKEWGTTHPVGFTQMGGVVRVKICVSPGDGDLVPLTQRAIATWEGLVRQTEQCENCFLWEEGEQFPATKPYIAESVILHELGHCAMGLDHPNLHWDDPGPISSLEAAIPPHTAEMSRF